MPSTDGRVVQYINSATQLLMNRGHWIGTMPTYEVQTNNNMLTLPPQLATVEGLAVSRRPQSIVSRWYQWSRNGYGLGGKRGDGLNINFDVVAPLGNYPTFADINNPPVGLPNTDTHQIQVVTDLVEATGAQMLFMVLDGSTPPNYVRTVQGGVYADGVAVALPAASGLPGVTTSVPNGISKILAIQKPVTNGQIWIYDYDVQLATSTLIGSIEYFETRPSYPRYLLPIIQGANMCWIDVFGKAAFRPVVNPTDYLIIGNLEALTMGCMAVRAREEHNWQDYSLYMDGGVNSKTGSRITGAIQILQDELDANTPASEEATVNMTGVEFSSPVESLV
jgi:hypothetical protein